MNIKEEREGQYFENVKGEKAEVIHYYNSGNVIIRFEEHSCYHKVWWSDLKKGHFKNPMKPYISGVGFVGQGEYKTKIKGKHTRAYRVWKAMLTRCYDRVCPTYYRYGGEGVLVDENWHNFQVFSEWYYAELGDRKESNLEIDKDILSVGNKKVYSERTCCLIPSKLNTTITRCKSNSVLGIKGIRKIPSGSYEVRITDETGKFKEYGTYKDLSTAKSVWLDNKFSITCTLIDELYSQGLILKKEYVTLLDKNWYYFAFFGIRYGEYEVDFEKEVNEIKRDLKYLLTENPHKRVDLNKKDIVLYLDKVKDVAEEILNRQNRKVFALKENDTLYVQYDKETGEIV